MSDTPTYEQLSALCAQMAAALETVKPSVMRYAPEASCREFEAALTAYRTLSPDPQWVKPVAWYWEYGDETLTNWHPHATIYKPQQVDDGSIRNITPLYPINRARGEG